MVVTLILLLFSHSLSIPSTNAASLYVSQSGTSGGSCSKSSPCLSVAQALSNAESGDQIHVIPETSYNIQTSSLSSLLNISVTIEADIEPSSSKLAKLTLNDDCFTTQLAETMEITIGFFECECSVGASFISSSAGTINLHDLSFTTGFGMVLSSSRYLTKSVISISGGTIRFNNVQPQYIYLASAPFIDIRHASAEFKNCHFMSVHTADSNTNGSAISCRILDEQLILDDCPFHSCTSKGYGGAVYILCESKGKGTVTVRRTPDESGINNPLYACQSSKSGGVFCISTFGSGKVSFEGDFNAHYNSASDSGGTLYLESFASAPLDFNLARLYNEHSAAGKNGAVLAINCTDSSTSLLTASITFEVRLSYCTAGGDGGALWIRAGKGFSTPTAAVTISSTPERGSLLSSCTAQGNGGGVALEQPGQGYFTMQTTDPNSDTISFSECTTTGDASKGGSVYYHLQSTLPTLHMSQLPVSTNYIRSYAKVGTKICIEATSEELVSAAIRTSLTNLRWPDTLLAVPNTYTVLVGEAKKQFVEFASTLTISGEGDACTDTQCPTLSHFFQQDLSSYSLSLTTLVLSSAVQSHTTSEFTITVPCRITSQSGRATLSLSSSSSGTPAITIPVPDNSQDHPGLIAFQNIDFKVSSHASPLISTASYYVTISACTFVPATDSLTFTSPFIEVDHYLYIYDTNFTSIKFQDASLIVVGSNGGNVDIYASIFTDITRTTTNEDVLGGSVLTNINGGADFSGVSFIRCTGDRNGRVLYSELGTLSIQSRYEYPHDGTTVFTDCADTDPDSTLYCIYFSIDSTPSSSFSDIHLTGTNANGPFLYVSTPDDLLESVIPAFLRLDRPSAKQIVFQTSTASYDLKDSFPDYLQISSSGTDADDCGYVSNGKNPCATLSKALTVYFAYPTDIRIPAGQKFTFRENQVILDRGFTLTGDKKDPPTITCVLTDTEPYFAIDSDTGQLATFKELAIVASPSSDSPQPLVSCKSHIDLQLLFDTVTITHDSSSSAVYPNGLFLLNSVKFTLKDTTFSGFSLYKCSLLDVSLQEGYFITEGTNTFENIASENRSGSVISFQFPGYLSLSNIVFKHCTVRGGLGGAIFVTYYEQSSISLTNLKFIDCSSSYTVHYTPLPSSSLSSTSSHSNEEEEVSGGALGVQFSGIPSSSTFALSDLSFTGDSQPIAVFVDSACQSLLDDPDTLNSLFPNTDPEEISYQVGTVSPVNGPAYYKDTQSPSPDPPSSPSSLLPIIIAVAGVVVVAVVVIIIICCLRKRSGKTFSLDGEENKQEKKTVTIDTDPESKGEEEERKEGEGEGEGKGGEGQGAVPSAFVAPEV